MTALEYIAEVKARLNNARLGVDMREDRELVRSTFRDVDRLVAMVEALKRQRDAYRDALAGMPSRSIADDAELDRLAAGGEVGA